MLTLYGIRELTDTRRPLLIVTGMAREMRLAAGPSSVVLGSGGNPAKLRDALAVLGGGGCRQVLSFGIAGGLDPALRPGDVVVGSAVRGGHELWPADRDFANRLAENLSAGGLQPVLAEIAGSDSVILDENAKQRLRHETGAAAVDMESHVAAAHAAAYGLRFAALRVVCDPAHRALPPLAATALRPDGGLDLPAVLGSLARHPGQLSATLRLARDARAAFASLSRCRDLLGIGRGFPDLGEFFGDVA
jgi:hopanoid-associated phosphorylase